LSRNSDTPTATRTSRWRRLRRHCWKGLAWFVIASAVLVSIGRLVAPYADIGRPVIERFLARALDQPVAIEAVEASWPHWSPQVELVGLTVGEADAPLMRVARARLEFRLYNLVRPAHNSFELAVLGLQVAVVQDADGRWRWRLDRGGEFARGWERSISAGDLVLRDSRVRLAPRGLPEFNWTVPEATLRRAGQRLGVRFGLEPEGGGNERLDVRMQLELPDSRLQRLRAFAESPDFKPSRFAADGPSRQLDDLRSQLQLWLDWQRDRGGRAHARVDLHSLADDGIAGRMSSHFELDARWDASRFAVELNAAEFDSRQPDLIDGLAYAVADGRRAVIAEHIDLEYLHALAGPWLNIDFGVTRLGGTLRGLALGLDDDAAPYLAAGRIEGLSLSVGDAGVDNLDAELSLAGDELVARPSGAPSLRLPTLYPQALSLTGIGGRLGWRPGRLTVAGLVIEHAELELHASGDVLLGRDPPRVDVRVAVPRLTPGDPRDWLPERGIGPNTRRWLERALVGLDSAHIEAALFGDPSGWAQHVPHGAVDARIDFTGLDLDYADNWPVGLDLDGQARFVRESMDAEIARGRVAGLALAAPRIRIARMRAAEVELSLRSLEDDAAELAALARALPLEGARTALDAMRWNGPASASARVWLPVRHREDWRLVGSVGFDGADLALPDAGLSIGAVDGQVPFTRSAIGPATLAVGLAGQSAEVALHARLRGEFGMDIAGQLPLAELVPGALRQAAPALIERIDGRSEVRLRLASSGDGMLPDGERRLELTATSDLAGTRLAFPPPLAKPADAVWPAELVVPLGDPPAPLAFELGDVVSGRVLLDDGFAQFGLGFGDAPARLPVAENFQIQGSIEELDLTGWAGLVEIASTRTDAGPVPRRGELGGWLELDVDRLRVGTTELGAVDIALHREQAYWRLRGSGERLDGSIRIPASGEADGDLVVDFARLYWPAAKDQPGGEADAPMRVDPRRLPAVDLAIADLRWGDLALGGARLSSHRFDQGLEIEQLAVRGEDLELTGSGQWRHAEPPETRMRLRLAAGNLGQALRQAGFDLALERGNAVLALDGAWSGSPLDFALADVAGALDVEIVDGAIPAAKPGAGRLLGLCAAYCPTPAR